MTQSTAPTIPPFLISQINDGKVVLFLGAGASKACKDTAGNGALDGNGLRDSLSDTYLGGSHKSDPLDLVAEYSIGQSDLITVQHFIAKQYVDLLPCEGHKYLPTFKWKLLATTNYDMVIENAYSGCAKRVQDLATRIHNGNRIEEQLQKPNALEYLKLHGCVTHIEDKDCPLILTVDQFNAHRSKRSRLFNRLSEIAYENTVVFIGYKLRDANIRSLINEIEKDGQVRPRYYLVSPGLSQFEEKVLADKNISAINTTFDDFMRIIHTQCHSQGVVVQTKDIAALPISKKFTVNNVTLSDDFIRYFSEDTQWTEGALKSDPLDAKQFYMGYDNGWYPIENNFDFSRHLCERVTTQLLEEKSSTRKDPGLIVITGHAGSGKSILLKRLAYNLGREHHILTIWHRPDRKINLRAIGQLHDSTNELVVLCVDKISDNIQELTSLLHSQLKRLIIVACERVNEWNSVSARFLKSLITRHELGYLSTAEIELLLLRLKEHQSLGALARLSFDEQKAQFREFADRQLLVALHESTHGRPFRDIIADEYERITPPEAKSIYLTICVLNRLGVPVRAGVIARTHGIPFSEFQDRLHKPLETIVYFEKSLRDYDYTYRTRHPIIAEIVFQNTLRNPEERLTCYQKALSCLNIDYDTDKKAYRSMIRAKSLLEVFPSHEYISVVYKAAFETLSDDHYLHQQYAIYEYLRMDGNLELSEKHLKIAISLAPWDPTLEHSLSTLYLKRSEKSTNVAEQIHYVDMSLKISESLYAGSKDDEYSFHTIILAYFRKFDIAMARKDFPPSEQDIETMTRSIEQKLLHAQQLIPDSPIFHSAEAEWSKRILASDRYKKALVKAHELNPRDSFISIRLARIFFDEKDHAKSIAVLEAALKAKPHDTSLHYRYALALLESQTTDDQAILYHLRSSYSPGDRSHDAKFRCGKQLFKMGMYKECKELFRQERPFIRGERHALHHPIENTYSGYVVRIDLSHAFVRINGSEFDVFCHADKCGDRWSQLAVGQSISFTVAFDSKGPAVNNLQ